MQKLGVHRAAIEADLRRACAGEDHSTFNPHAVDVDSPAEQAVAHFAALVFAPTYGTLMYVAHVWSRAGRSLKEWITRQYATAINEGEARGIMAALGDIVEVWPAGLYPPR